MKLILCPKCSDLFKLTHTFRKCECGKSAGNYVDDLNAVTYGEAIPIGFANYSFIKAIKSQPEEGMGAEFTAFIIPKKCPTIVHHNKMKSAKRKKTSAALHNDDTSLHGGLSRPDDE